MSGQRAERGVSSEVGWAAGLGEGSSAGRALGCRLLCGPAGPGDSSLWMDGRTSEVSYTGGGGPCSCLGLFLLSI